VYQCMGLTKFEDLDTHSDENNSPSSGNLFLSPFSDTMDIIFECRRRWLRGKIRLCRKGGRFCHRPSHTRTVRYGYVKKLSIRVQFLSSINASNLVYVLNISTESTTIPIPFTPFHQSFAPVSLLPSCFSFVTSTTVPSLHRMRRP